MARILFCSKNHVYDTERQSGRLYQVVERFTIGDGRYEKCVVSDVKCDDNGEYRYTLIGLKTLEIYTTRFIFDESESASGFFADLNYPVFLAKEQVEAIKTRAAAHRAEQEERTQRFLNRSTQIVDYSEKSLAIFSSDPNDVPILERIRAKRNNNLTWKGRKVAGWVFPKYRQEELPKWFRSLDAVVSP